MLKWPAGQQILLVVWHQETNRIDFQDPVLSSFTNYHDMPNTSKNIQYLTMYQCENYRNSAQPPAHLVFYEMNYPLIVTQWLRTQRSKACVLWYWILKSSSHHVNLFKHLRLSDCIWLFFRAAPLGCASCAILIALWKRFLLWIVQHRCFELMSSERKFISLQL